MRHLAGHPVSMSISWTDSLGKQGSVCMPKDILVGFQGADKRTRLMLFRNGQFILIPERGQLEIAAV